MSDRTILIGGGTNKTTTLKKLLEDTYTREKEDFAIAELEKIKAEILEQAKTHQDFQNYVNGLMYTYSILSTRIEELKGENK